MKIVCVLVTAIPCVPDSGLGQAEKRVTRLVLQTVSMRRLYTNTGALTHLVRRELHGAKPTLTLTLDIMSTVLGRVWEC